MRSGARGNRIAVEKKIEEALFIQIVNELFERSQATRGYDKRHDFPSGWTISSIRFKIEADLGAMKEWQRIG